MDQAEEHRIATRASVSGHPGALVMMVKRLIVLVCMSVPIAGETPRQGDLRAQSSYATALRVFVGSAWTLGHHQETMLEHRMSSGMRLREL
jgi:hypothetical protein